MEHELDSAIPVLEGHCIWGGLSRLAESTLDPWPDSPPFSFRSRCTSIPAGSAASTLEDRLQIIIRNLLRAKTLSLRLSLERKAAGFAGRSPLESSFLCPASCLGCSDFNGEVCGLKSRWKCRARIGRISRRDLMFPADQSGRETFLLPVERRCSLPFIVGGWVDQREIMFGCVSREQSRFLWVASSLEDNFVFGEFCGKELDRLRLARAKRCGQPLVKAWIVCVCVCFFRVTGTLLSIGIAGNNIAQRGTLLKMISKYTK